MNVNKKVDPAKHELISYLNLSPSEIASMKIYEGKGCPHCNNTGYKGRCGLYEVLPITSAIQELIIAKAPPFTIQSKAIEEGMLSLRTLVWKN